MKEMEEFPQEELLLFLSLLGRREASKKGGQNGRSVGGKWGGRYMSTPSLILLSRREGFCNRVGKRQGSMKGRKGFVEISSLPIRRFFA